MTDDRVPTHVPESAVFLAAFGPDGSAVRRNSDRVFDHVVVPAADRHQLRVYKADRASAPGALTPQIFELLRSCRIVVCDISVHSPSVFYELGVVHAANLPVVLLGDRTDALPFYVKDERIIAIGDESSESQASAVERLSEAMAIALSPAYIPRSPVGEALGLAGPFPPVLREAIRHATLPYYREGMKYDLRFSEVGPQHALIRFSLSYTLVNRSRNDYVAHAGIIPMRPFKPVFAQIGRDEIDPEHPDHVTERGWRVLHGFPAGSATDVRFVADVKYRMPDADVFATYLPATDFELAVRYPADRIRVVAESLFRTHVDPDQMAPGVVCYRPREALLAYQGFRLDWLAPRPPL